jgi:hypothetical protein
VKPELGATREPDAKPVPGETLAQGVKLALALDAKPVLALGVKPVLVSDAQRVSQYAQRAAHEQRVSQYAQLAARVLPVSGAWLASAYVRPALAWLQGSQPCGSGLSRSLPEP